MKVDELFVLYHTTRDTIISVHSTRHWAEQKLKTLDKFDRNATIVATLEEGISWEISAAKAYAQAAPYSCN